MVQCSFFLFLNWVQSKKRNKHFPCLLRFQICLSILMKQTLNLKKKKNPPPSLLGLKTLRWRPHVKHAFLVFYHIKIIIKQVKKCCQKEKNMLSPLTKSIHVKSFFFNH